MAQICWSLPDNKLTMKITFFRVITLIPILLIMSLFNGCTSHAPVPTPEHVDIDRFMGRWYVLGYTPIIVDKQAHNATEHYRLDEDNKIQTTYQFRDGGFDAELKTYTPVGWVEEDVASNAEWQMQFIWPFSSDYVILYLAEDYSRTIIVHPNRKYVWIMQRETQISDADFEAMIQKIEAEGFDRSLIKRLPHDWSGETERLAEMKAAGL